MFILTFLTAITGYYVVCVKVIIYNMKPYFVFRMESNANNFTANNSPSISVKHSLSTFNNNNNNGNNVNNSSSSSASSPSSNLNTLTNTSSNGTSRLVPNGILKRPPRPPTNNNSANSNNMSNSSPIISAVSTPTHHRTVAVAKQTARNEEVILAFYQSLWISFLRFPLHLLNIICIHIKIEYKIS